MNLLIFYLNVVSSIQLKESFTSVQETFMSYMRGFVNDVPKYLFSLLIIIIGFLISSFIAKVFKHSISKRSKDPLMTNFLTKVVKIGFILLIIMLALKVAGLQDIAAGLFTAAGASAIIFGFAFRDIGENFISGVILSFKRPFDVNDTVLIGDIFGRVKTKLKTFDGRDVYIPNSDIVKKAVYNYTEDGYYRLDFIVGIDYADDIELAKKLIIDTVVNTDGVINTNTHSSFVTVDSLGVSTVNLKIFFWTKTMDYRRGALDIKSDLIQKVKEVIIENGLNMPADIKEIKMYGSQSSIPVTVNPKKE